MTFIRVSVSMDVQERTTVTELEDVQDALAVALLATARKSVPIVFQDSKLREPHVSLSAESASSKRMTPPVPLVVTIVTSVPTLVPVPLALQDSFLDQMELVLLLLNVELLTIS